MNISRKHDYDICMVDSSKHLREEGFVNLCRKYGKIKNISIQTNQYENQAFIKFEEDNSVYKLLNEKSNLPSFVKIELPTIIHEDTDQVPGKQNDVDSENVKSNKNQNSIFELEIQNGQPIYFGPEVFGINLIETWKQLKLNDKTKLFNLENDELFGRPLNKKWEKIERIDFGLNNLDFYYRFKNCYGGKIEIEKILSPNIFTGWISIFNGSENVHDILKNISHDIERSNPYDIDDLKCGMLVGAFDNFTNTYARGYVIFVAGNSVNVALCDYGRVIKTFDSRILPEKYISLAAYSFKVYTKNKCLPQLIDKSYIFKVHNVCAERTVLIMLTELEDIKIQLKKWQPTVEECGVPYVNFKTGSSVEILKIKDTNSLYIKSKENHHMEQFFSIWNSIAGFCYKDGKPLNRDPFYGEIIGFKSIINGNYVRARVHKYLGNETYSVKHMDNPFIEDIKASEMIKLHFEQKSLPVTMLIVGLKGSLPYPIQGYAKDFVKHVINVRLIVNFDESQVEGWKSVNLIIGFVRENFNNILLGLVEPMWLKDTPNDMIEEVGNYLKYFSLPINELQEKSVVTMTFVMFYDNVFYMRDKSFGKSFSLLSNMIREYCSLNLNPYLPHNEEVCLGRFSDGLWYRIVCDQIKPGQYAKVHFVDLGNTAFLNSRSIKKCPPELLFHPTHAYLCLLKDFIEMDEKKLKLLRTYENTDIEFTIVKNLGGKNHYLIKCPFLENILK